jgi:hypothetical protein
MRVVFLVEALNAALYATDPSAGNVWQAMLLPIIDFFILCAAPLWPARGVGGRRQSGRSD